MGDADVECSSGGTARLLSAAVEEGGGGRGSRPKEPWRGEYVKSVVYAGLDAIITCFSLISSISATRRSSAVTAQNLQPIVCKFDEFTNFSAANKNVFTVDVLVLGFANLVADAISMGLGDFLSSKAEQDVLVKKRQATEWDVANHRSEEQKELIRHYEALGMENHDATMAVNMFAKYKNILVEQRMGSNKEMVPADGEVQPWKNGLVTFVSFMLFGSAPLLAIVVLIPFTNNDSVKFMGSCIVTALVLALLGVAKARIASNNYVSSVAITLFNGIVAAAAAYSLGWSL
ncbi:uncharacterized protein LOC114727002 [Neltuma alba]|uniref:uncharacterized protein LOC114727002 n=1 Tax=Neltuma alba TaxID=207710 RepID=UPI0010A45BE2|nr:uncharacterized protein LOC114727002 [Prosopis alba]